MTETKEEFGQRMREHAVKLMDVKRKIDAAWKEGDRDMLYANIYGLADDVLRLMDAIEKADVNAFRVSAEECRDHASGILFHSPHTERMV